MAGADGVYPASEDTYLLIDALTNDVGFLTDVAGKGGLLIEIGCGSGEVLDALGSLLPNCACFGSDVNKLAAEKSCKLMKEQRVQNTDVIMGDMFSLFRAGVLFDIIVFNPPYVPTDDEELQRALHMRDISASWAGGQGGRVVIDQFLADCMDFLSPRGVAYVVLLDKNKPHQLAADARRDGHDASLVMERKAGIEQLYILRIQRRN